MKQTVPLGRVAGIPVGMHWSVLVMVIVIGWLLGGRYLPETTPDQSAGKDSAPHRPGNPLRRTREPGNGTS